MFTMRGSPDSETLALPQEAKPGLPALVQNRDPQPALHELGRSMSLGAAGGAGAAPGAGAKLQGQEGNTFHPVRPFQKHPQKVTTFDHSISGQITKEACSSFLEAK